MNPFTQMLIAVSIPTLTVLMGSIVNNSRLSDLRSDVNKDFNNMRADMNRRFDEVDRRFDEIDRRFTDVARRFDDVKEFWRSALHRVEEVLDARLKQFAHRR